MLAGYILRAVYNDPTDIQLHAGSRRRHKTLAEHITVNWSESGAHFVARWRSENGTPPPRRIVVADDGLSANKAYRLACEGTAILWRGDFQNARQMLQSLQRRAVRKGLKPGPSMRETFHLHRQAQAQCARTLRMLLVPLDGEFNVPLRRAPQIRQACIEAYGLPDGNLALVSLRELLGLIGAHEWRKKGVQIPFLDDKIHPYYGVFSPIRGEYVQLVAEAPMPPCELAFDIGAGTGVLAVVLARRGAGRVVATDQDARALACARDNVARLGLADRVEVLEVDLFPPGRADLIVCNPPWIPAKPGASVESAVYDPDSRMLLGFLAGLREHLAPQGEGWLILSDIAEHLGIRTREELLNAIDHAGLKVVAKIDTRPIHSKVKDASDPLHSARAAEVTSLWRLVAA